MGRKVFHGRQRAQILHAFRNRAARRVRCRSNFLNGGALVRRIAVSLMSMLMFPVCAAAQSPAVFGGYEWARPSFETSLGNVNFFPHLLVEHLNGWKAGATIPIAGGLAVVGQADAVYGKQFGLGIVVPPLGA